MRIITGSLRGRSLKTLTGADTRPAMGRTREALFSMLESRGMDWQGKRVLDLFSGCGSLAFEALSRGASVATLVDNAAAACRCIARNMQNLQVEDHCRVSQREVRKFLATPSPLPYDMVFIDPPYGRNYVQPTLYALLANGWLESGAFISAEMEKQAFCALPHGIIPITERLFGQTRVWIWQLQGDSE